MAGTGTGRRGGKAPETPGGDDQGYDEGLEPQRLGEVAAAGLHAVADGTGEVQETLNGMEYNTHLGFLGMGFRTNDADYKIGQEVSFVVRGMVTHAGDQLMKDGHQRHIVKVTVSSVTTPED